MLIRTIGDELAWIGVLDVRGLETYRETERLLLGAALEKLNGLFADDLREVLVFSAFVFSFVGLALAGTSPPEVVLVSREIIAAANPIFADETDTVACTAKQQRIGLGEVFLRETRPEVVDPMSAYVLTAEDAGATGSAYRRSNKSICETDTTGCQVIQVWSLDDSITGTA